MMSLDKGSCITPGYVTLAGLHLRFFPHFFFFFFLRFFIMDHFFKVFTEFFTILLLFLRFGFLASRQMGS